MTQPPHPYSVTVVIPTRNRWPWLAEAVDSALAQTHPQTEIIVVDDASTDGTQQHLLSRYASRVQVIQQPTQQQKSISRNQGIRAARTAFICMLDSDDLLLPDSIENRLLPYRADPPFQGVSYGARQSARLPREGASGGFPNGDILHAYIRNFGILDNNAFLLRTNDMLRYGMYHPELTNMEDREMLIRLTAHLPFRYCGKVTHEVRRVDPASARHQYADIVRQGTAFSRALRQDSVLLEKLGPEIRHLEYIEAKEQTRSLYKLKKYGEYLKAAQAVRGEFPEWETATLKTLRRRGMAQVLKFFSSPATESP